MVGYMHPSYAESLCEFGIPQKLPRCGGSILIRHIPGFSDVDAMGCYPLFFCQDWSQLHSDLQNIDSKLVSLAIVTDPFGRFDHDYLSDNFDRVVPFKEHFVVDLQHSYNDIVSTHHRYYAKKALNELKPEECTEPLLFIDEWFTLYTNLINRHKLEGIKAFSRNAFAKQLTIPGIVVLRAVQNGITVGAHIWYVHGDVAYSHLAAFSQTGYALMASYALYSYAITYFSDKVRWLDLGAGAGASNDKADGLSRFKRGWSTGIRQVYFCGRIFNHQQYAAVVESKRITATDYFPAYRKDEFF